MMKKSETHSRQKAVALTYRSGEMEAPVVSAKGIGKVAEKIIQIAKEHQVPIQEDRSLVEVLAKLDLQQQIPAELYGIAAEILSAVYRADRLAAAEKEG